KFQCFALQEWRDSNPQPPVLETDKTEEKSSDYERPVDAQPVLRQRALSRTDRPVSPPMTQLDPKTMKLPDKKLSAKERERLRCTLLANPALPQLGPRQAALHA